MPDVFPVEGDVTQLFAEELDLALLHGLDATLEPFAGVELNPVIAVLRWDPAQVGQPGIGKAEGEAAETGSSVRDGDVVGYDDHVRDHHVIGGEDGLEENGGLSPEGWKGRHGETQASGGAHGVRRPSQRPMVSKQ